MKNWKFYCLCLAIALAIASFVKCNAQDTLWVNKFNMYTDTCPCYKAPKKPEIKEAKFSDFNGDMAGFVNYAAAKGIKAVIDVPFEFRSSFNFPPNEYVFRAKVANFVRPAIFLRDGKYKFDSLSLRQIPEDAIFIYSNDMTNETVVTDMSVLGGDVFYSKTGGGRYDFANDTVITWTGVTFNRCNFHTVNPGILSYSSRGPCSYVNEFNCIHKTDKTHNEYHHGNVSYEAQNCDFIGFGLNQSGNPALCMRRSTGGPGKPKYFRLTNVRAVGAWQIYAPEGGASIVGSTIEMYQDPIEAQNFYGDTLLGFIRGNVNNCIVTKQVRIMDGSFVDGGKYEIVDLQYGGKITFDGLTKLTTVMSVNNVAGKLPLELVFKNCPQFQWNLSVNAGVKVTLINTPLPKAMWGWQINPADLTIIKQ